MTNKFTKTIAGVLGFAIALSLVVVASTAPAKADTISDLQAQIANLTAQLSKLAGTSAVSTASFTANLTVGSKGAEVTALQNFLISGGYKIAAGATGTFGPQTKAALAAYQTANGISPAAGYFGPVTRAKVNGVAVVSSTPAASTSVVADGTDGSITLSSSSYVTSSQSLKKGDMNKPVIAVRAQATAGAVTVQRVDVHVSTRPWLIFGSLSLTDSNGKVLATKTLSSSADATEVTVGSDYLVRFDNVNAVVTPGSDVTLVVNASVLSATDKITSTPVVFSIPTGSVRTINGKGYTDSLGTSNTGTVTLSVNGATADAYTRISPSTPDTTTTNISTSNVTSDQVLGVFDVKVQNQGATVNGLTFNINTVGNPTAKFQNVRVYNGNTLVGGANSFSSTGTAVFTNITLALVQDSWTSLTLKADVIATSSSFSASSTIVAAGIVGVDNNYNTITLGYAGDRVSNNVTFVPNAGISVTGITVTKGSPTFTQAGLWVGAYPTIAFTINNTGTNPIYVSKTAASAIGYSATGVSASTTITNVVASGSVTGDTATSYVINGSRTFTYSFTADNTGGTTASRTITLTDVKYGLAGADASDHLLDVNYGLTTATVTLP